ncbi:MAG: T9SS type A sorting domain-containing protein [Bacteroidales bacterium]|jgi:hypothetical protein|nr:T9SS type A sorting domain-containing protein [Bacteroidales bacterium]MDD4213929.1 T9SS type A sorting domain-containing protein [Bacteroidales bacterium]
MKKITLFTLGIIIFGFVSAQQKVGPNYVASTSKSQIANIDYSLGLKAGKNITVAILSPDSTTSTDAIVSFLSGFSDITVTAIPFASVASLALGTISSYDVCFIYNDVKWETAGTTRTAAGDVLGSYVAGGGKVIECQYVKSYDEWGLAGSYITGNYSAFGSTTTDSWAATAMGTVIAPAHPIMVGVSSMTQNFDTQDPSLATGADEIVDWDDGTIAIAAKPNVVSFNLLPVEPDGTITLGGDCWVAIHNAIVWMNGSAGIQDNSISEISIYPNPVHDFIYLNDFTDVDIFNVFGQMVGSYKNVKTINVSDYNEGNYFVRIINGNNTITKKITII